MYFDIGMTLHQVQFVLIEMWFQDYRTKPYK
jgi:hypothetical protein